MIAVHAGFAKTATSTLQRGVFSRHEQINYLGLPAHQPSLGDLIHAIAKADSITFDLGQARATMAPHLNPVSPAKTTLVSYENFSLYESRDKGLIAQRLREIFGQCQILFTIRRQEDLLRAWYLQKLPKYLIGHNYVDFSRWFNQKALEPHKSILDDLDFNYVIEHYEQIFGRDHVGVFCFEELRRDPANYVREMADFLEIDGQRFAQLLDDAHYNLTIAQRRVVFGRISTDYLPRFILRHGPGVIPRKIRKRFNKFLDRGPGAKVELSLAAEQWIAAHCRAGNRELDARYGGRLSRHGYGL